MRSATIVSILQCNNINLEINGLRANCEKKIFLFTLYPYTRHCTYMLHYLYYDMYIKLTNIINISRTRI